MSMPKDISAKVGNPATAQLTYDHGPGQARVYNVRKVHPADGPQRDRPVTHLSMDGDYVIFRDRLESCVFVGDQVDFVSPTSGQAHHGIVIGEAWKALDVLIENWVTVVQLESVIRLNGRRVIDDKVQP